jgi:hypothetical protein
MCEDPRNTEANVKADVSVIAMIFVVALTVVSAASLFVAVSDFGVPEPEYPPFEDETSPFAVEYVEGTLAGDPVKTALYDSTTGEESEYGFDGSRKSPPSVEDGVADSISGLRGASSFPSGFAGGELRVPSGDYYIGSSETRIGLGSDKIVFDTTDGPVRVAVDEGGSLSVSANFVVEGSNGVEFYVSRSNVFGNDLYIFDSNFENHRTDAVRVYAQPDRGNTSDVKFENTDYRGTVYAPGATVEFVDSTVWGASVAEKTVLEDSSYYHDKHLERLGEDALPE